MSRLRRRISVGACAAALALAFGTGCTYLRDRGLDATDILDAGITVSSKPGFAVYFDSLNVMPIGFSSVDGRLLGWGQRQVGALEFKDSAWGVLLVGEEQNRIGSFDPRNPHLMSPDAVRRLEAAGKPLPVEASRYSVGALGLSSNEEPPPWPTFVSGRRNVHIGFLGIYLGIRPIDIGDFILGVFTLDPVGDDSANRLPAVSGGKTDPPAIPAEKTN